MDIDFFEFLKEIRKGPKLHLGEISLFALEHFKNGYLYKEFEINGRIQHIEILCKFQGYIEKLYGLSETTKSCFMIVRELSEDEEETFYLFFKLLDDFLDGQQE